MSNNDPHARYALRGADDADGDLREDRFEDQVSRQWFTPQIDRKLLKTLMKRSDWPALGNYGLWLALLAASGTAACLTWGTAWSLPALMVYGVLYSTSDHRAHELSHGTPFRTRWLNDALYHLNGFMTLHEGRWWRWGHTRHHTHTLTVGRDPEIAAPRPVRLSHVVMDFFFLHSGPIQISNICRCCSSVGRTASGSHTKLRSID